MSPAARRRTEPAARGPAALDQMKAHASDAAALMKTLGNEQRLLVLCNLLEQPMTVGELNQRMSLSQSALSQHLALLREAGTRGDTPGSPVDSLLAAPRAGDAGDGPAAGHLLCARFAGRSTGAGRRRPRLRRIARRRSPTLLLALLGALAIGLSLGLLGSGGSILTVPVLHYLVGQPDKLAIGGSLLVVGLIAAAGCVPYALRRQVDWRNVAWFGLPGMGGAWVGATLAHWVPGPVQLALFSGVMLLAAWRMLRGGSRHATRPRSDGASRSSGAAWASDC